MAVPSDVPPSLGATCACSTGKIKTSCRFRDHFRYPRTADPSESFQSIIILRFIMMSAILLAFIGSASAFAVAAPTRVAIRRSSLSSPTMGFFDNLGKGNFFEDESPQDETKAFDARSRKQVKTLPSGGEHLSSNPSDILNPSLCALLARNDRSLA